MIEEAIEGMLSAQQARVLACLMEKQMTTPDYYPLTLKALTAACNQKSSRVPVMNLTASEVGGVVNDLRAEGLITARMDGRADRFEQHLSRKLGISTKERALLCVLMLRSALTLNEIRINTGRMVSFESAEELQALLDQWIGSDDPLLVRIPRAAGQREDRYAHLLCGKAAIDVVAEALGGTEIISGTEVTGGTTGSNKLESDRIAQLEKDVADLKEQFQQFRQDAGL
ncbi:MAG: YceH family protein [Mariprofundus sp.]|nr:YceH family protein [Mariprofundus sp.]